MTTKKFLCPKCKAELTLSVKDKLPTSFPFCSARCKLIDLGAWAKEEYRMQAQDQSGEEDLDNTKRP
jgi:endogenous inhibitor of DNA gyrase (YacG/DUF329 family)